MLAVSLLANATHEEVKCIGPGTAFLAMRHMCALANGFQNGVSIEFASLKFLFRRCGYFEYLRFCRSQLDGSHSHSILLFISIFFALPPPRLSVASPRLTKSLAISAVLQRTLRHTGWLFEPALSTTILWRPATSGLPCPAHIHRSPSLIRRSSASSTSLVNCGTKSMIVSFLIPSKTVSVKPNTAAACPLFT